MEFSELEKLFHKWLHLAHDPHLLRLIFACALANRYDGLPVWTMLVGPSGCGKSEILMSLGASDDVIAVSNLTPYALASGHGDGSDSLIYQLDQKLLVVEDMSAIAAMPKEPRNLLFSFFRAAYNGEFTRTTGRGSVEWKGKFGLMGGTTLALERGREMEAMLGERFLNVRFKVSDNDEKTMMRRARKNAISRAPMTKDLRTGCSVFLERFQIDKAEKKVPSSKWMEDYIEDTAIALAKARSTVIRDTYSKDITFPVDRGELGTRLHNQLLLVALSARALKTDWEFVEDMLLRLMLDSIPYIRLRALQAVHSGAARNKDIAKAMGMSDRAVSHVLEEMRRLKLLRYGNGKKHEIIDSIFVQAMDRVDGTS